MNCTVTDISNIGSFIPKETSYSATLYKDNAWMIKKTFDTPMSSPCCSKIDMSYPNSLLVRTYKCSVNDTKYRASGDVKLYMNYHDGVCSWAHE